MCARSQIFFWGIETGGLFYKAMHASDLRVLETKSPEFARKTFFLVSGFQSFRGTLTFSPAFSMTVGRLACLWIRSMDRLRIKSVSMPKQSCCGIQFPALVKTWVIYSVNHVYLTFDWFAEITFPKNWILELSTLFPNFKHSREDFRSQVPTCDGMN